MCSPNLEYQYLNPTTQVALFSIYTGNCTGILHITWNISQGSNISSNNIQWRPFDQIDIYKNVWFFGRNKIFRSLFLFVIIANFRKIYKKFYFYETTTSNISTY